MSDNHGDPALFTHIRILIGMVLGLGVTRLLSGLARIIQHPGRIKLYSVHLAWALWMLLMLVHFWWWEFGLSRVPGWTFESYLYVIGYAVVFFLICSLLFPDDMSDYNGYRDYLLSRRRWIFGLIALSFVVDIGDTLIKGRDYLDRLGPEYPVRNAGMVLLCLVAMKTRNPRFHAIFVALAVAYELTWIVRFYNSY